VGRVGIGSKESDRGEEVGNSNSNEKALNSG